MEHIFSSKEITIWNVKAGCSNNELSEDIIPISFSFYLQQTVVVKKHCFVS